MPITVRIAVGGDASQAAHQGVNRTSIVVEQNA